MGAAPIEPDAIGKAQCLPIDAPAHEERSVGDRRQPPLHRAAQSKPRDRRAIDRGYTFRAPWRRHFAGRRLCGRAPLAVGPRPHSTSTLHATRAPDSCRHMSVGPVAKPACPGRVVRISTMLRRRSIGHREGMLSVHIHTLPIDLCWSVRHRMSAHSGTVVRDAVADVAFGEVAIDA